MKLLYAELLNVARRLGPFQEEVKKTSIHLVRDAAFLGVHPRKSHLLVTVKSGGPIASPRIAKAEQVSKYRWHLDIELAEPAEIDDEFTGWMSASYALCRKG
jgi:hypothetical protein